MTEHRTLNDRPAIRSALGFASEMFSTLPRSIGLMIPHISGSSNLFVLNVFPRFSTCAKSPSQQGDLTIEQTTAIFPKWKCGPATPQRPRTRAGFVVSEPVSTASSPDASRGQTGFSQRPQRPDPVGCAPIRSAR